MKKTYRKLRTSWLPLVLLLFLPSLLFSQEADASEDRICLWEASRTDGGSIHLLGSLHLMKEADYPLDPRFEEVFDSVDAVVFETDIAAASSPELQSYMLSKAFYPEESGLETELSKSVYTALEEFLSQIGIPIQSVNTFKPWFLGLSITTLQMIQLGYDPSLGIDRYFYDRAAEESKTVLGLESPEFQIDLLASLADIDQDSYIQQVIDEFDTLNAQLEQIIAAWKSGDLEKINGLNDSLREYPAFYETLIVERNQAWLVRVEDYLEERGNLLVIVGAGHMAGKKGLITLLKEKGYRVSQY